MGKRVRGGAMDEEMVTHSRFRPAIKLICVGIDVIALYSRDLRDDGWESVSEAAQWTRKW